MSRHSDFESFTSLGCSSCPGVGDHPEVEGVGIGWLLPILIALTSETEKEAKARKQSKPYSYPLSQGQLARNFCPSHPKSVVL